MESLEFLELLKQSSLALDSKGYKCHKRFSLLPFLDNLAVKAVAQLLFQLHYYPQRLA
jgi:hypothetical protein